MLITMPTPIRKVKRREPIRDPDAQPKMEIPHTPSKRQKTVVIDSDELGMLTPPATPSGFSLGKSLFQRGTACTRVIGREKEQKIVRNFIDERITGQAGGALYLSGLPGTGKTALINSVLKGYKSRKDTKIVQLNCMTISRLEETFSIVLGEFGHQTSRTKNSSVNRSRATQQLNELFSAQGCTHILLLDELDHLMRGDQEVLFKFFEWSCQHNTNLVLLGIANTLDLTDRFLPRLQAHKLSPQVLAVRPYSEEQISRIIEGRLRTLRPADDEIPLMTPAAITMCAKKVAAQMGDLRKVFDICCRSIALVEEEYLISNPDSRRSEDVLHLPRVSVQHIAMVCHEAFGGANTVQRIRALNFVQQAVLCVILVQDRKLGVSQSLQVNDIYKAYKSMVDMHDTWTALDFSDLTQILITLEGYSLITITGVCGKRGMGGVVTRSSRGGGGATSYRSPAGLQDSYGLRRVSPQIQLMDGITAMASHDSLKKLLLEFI